MFPRSLSLHGQHTLGLEACRNLLFDDSEGGLKTPPDEGGNGADFGGQKAEKARVYADSEPSDEYLEILNFRHYTHFWGYDQSAPNGRKKEIVDSIEVSVVLHLVTV